ncbi:hypothetical protein PJF56_15005 [Roseofilum sp. BLCC_M91]|uniref:Low temperature-induced protein n=1 Tax=Roseofilum halophilum BLCC-M91 TaxID=3022259 RepID=A0ABT7BPG9_9CYAN|nr:hypothetical protein [Roseofilum halophilum]MDJ1180173.1 hypothetical protein [Roseofilum halophilum BLCC-M91]
MSIKPLNYILFTLLTGLGLSLLTQASFAQTTIDPLEEIQSQDGSSGVFSNQGGNSQFFDLMHNLQRGNNLRNPEQFNIDQQQNLDDAAAKFRQQQLERLNNRPESIQPSEEPTP